MQQPQVATNHHISQTTTMSPQPTKKIQQQKQELQRPQQPKEVAGGKIQLGQADGAHYITCQEHVSERLHDFSPKADIPLSNYLHGCKRELLQHLNSPNDCQAGSTEKCAENWEKITRDKEILNMVKALVV